MAWGGWVGGVYFIFKVRPRLHLNLACYSCKIQISTWIQYIFIFPQPSTCMQCMSFWKPERCLCTLIPWPLSPNKHQHLFFKTASSVPFQKWKPVQCAVLDFFQDQSIRTKKCSKLNAFIWIKHLFLIFIQSIKTVPIHANLNVYSLQPSAV